MQNLFISMLTMASGRWLFCYSVIMKHNLANLQSVLAELAAAAAAATITKTKTTTTTIIIIIIMNI
jgi:hypothetical protein